jgi:hypothetical protein
MSWFFLAESAKDAEMTQIKNPLRSLRPLREIINPRNGSNKYQDRKSVSIKGHPEKPMFAVRNSILNSLAFAINSFDHWLPLRDNSVYPLSFQQLRHSM